MSGHPSNPDQLMAHALGVCWHSPTSDRWPCQAARDVAEFVIGVCQLWDALPNEAKVSLAAEAVVDDSARLRPKLLSELADRLYGTPSGRTPR